MAHKNIRVVQESSTGRNQKFIDTNNGKTMTRAQFSNEIKQGHYQGYHVRKINGLNTPVSNPDKSAKNNLG